MATSLFPNVAYITNNHTTYPPSSQHPALYQTIPLPKPVSLNMVAIATDQPTSQSGSCSYREKLGVADAHCNSAFFNLQGPLFSYAAAQLDQTGCPKLRWFVDVRTHRQADWLVY